MTIAVILAGGIGSRMGLDQPKQFSIIAGKPIIVHTCEKFLCHPEVEHIVVLAPEAWVDYTSGLLPGVQVVAGGNTRNATLRSALSYVEERFCNRLEKLGDEDPILITHDAVRPFVTQQIISENIRAAREYGACGTVIPATDTIYSSAGGEFIDNVPARSQMYQAQTPQTFRFTELTRMMNALTPEEEATTTDACMLFALKKAPVKMVRGDVSNIKITYPQDLTHAELC